MSLPDHPEPREVTGIDDTQKSLIKAFLQGAVYSWLKATSGAEFAARDLVGGENNDWRGTPLEALYSKHRDQGKDHEGAVDAAAKDLGWLLKAVISADKRRRFTVRKDGLVSTYQWDGTVDHSDLPPTGHPEEGV